MKHSDQGITRDTKGEEQPKDKQRAQTVHQAEPEKSVSREATRDVRAANQAPGTGARPNDNRDTPTE